MEKSEMLIAPVWGRLTYGRKAGLGSRQEVWIDNVRNSLSFVSDANTAIQTASAFKLTHSKGKASCEATLR